MNPASPLPITAFALLFLAIDPVPLFADEKDGKRSETADPDLVFAVDFEDQEAGDVPGDYFVIEGDWSVVEIDGGKSMKLAEAPLVEAQVQLGDSLRDIGGTVRARIKADRKRRSYPRFGVGLHGMSGYRLRLFPVQNQLELVKSDEVIETAELAWTPGEWWFLELTVKPVASGDQWTISGRAWPESGSRPEKPQIEATSDEDKFSGKASVTGTAYAGLPIYFDDIEVRKAGDPATGEKGEE